MRFRIPLLLILFASCTPKSRYRQAADEIRANLPAATYMNAGNKDFTMYVPEGWTTEQRRVYNTDIFYLDAPKTADDPHTSINLVTEHMKGLDMAEYKRKSIISLKKSIPGVLVHDHGTIQAPGLDGVWYSYEVAAQGMEAAMVCYMFPSDGVVYTLTAGTQKKDAARYRSLFDSVAGSLQLIDREPG